MPWSNQGGGPWGSGGGKGPWGSGPQSGGGGGSRKTWQAFKSEKFKVSAEFPAKVIADEAGTIAQFQASSDDADFRITCSSVPLLKGKEAAFRELRSMRDAIAEFVPDGSSVAVGLQLEQMIPFAAGHEIIRQKKRDLRLIGPISDCLFDQLIGAGCVKDVVAAWVGNVMMGQAYNFRRAVEAGEVRVFNMTNFTIALGLQAGAIGVPFLPTRTARGSDVPKGNHFFYTAIGINFN